MRAISRFFLSILAPWNGFLTATISSLPGATKSSGELTTLGADITKTPNESDPNEVARYNHDLALEANKKGDTEKAKRLMELAAKAGATIEDITKTIEENSELL